MKSVGKVLKWVLSIVAILIVLAVIIVYFTSNSIIKNTIEAGATKALKVDVSLDRVALSLTKARFEMAGLNIANPKGYKTDTMLTVSDITVDSSYSKLLAKPAVIDKIELGNITITLEQKGLTNNIQDLLENISSSKPATDTSHTENTDNADNDKKLIVKELYIKGIKVNAKLLPIGGKEQMITFNLDPITMTDLGSGKPVDIAEISSNIMTALVTGIVGSGAGLLPAELTNTIGSSLNIAKDTLGSSIDIGKTISSDAVKQSQQILKVGEDAGKELQNAGDSIKKGLDDLFKSKK